MRGLVFVFLVALAVFASQSASALEENPASAQPGAPNLETVRAALSEGVNKAANNELAGAIELLKPVVANPIFSQLSDQEQRLAYLVLGEAELNSEDPQEALSMLKLATQSLAAQGEDWHWRLDAAYRTRNYDDCVISLTTIAQRWPDSLSEVTDSAIVSIGLHAANTSDDAAITLLAPLHAAKRHSEDRFEQTADGLWFDLARAYIDRGDIAAAVPVLNDVSDVGVIISIHMDRRFDSVVARNPSHFDVRAAFSSEIEELQAASAAAPNKLEGVNALADILIISNRAEDALKLLDAAVDKGRPADGVPATFDDYDARLNWTLNNRARALFVLGRIQEGLDAMQHGARRPENGNVNASQVINLAESFDSLGRPHDALDAVSDLSTTVTSPFGKMELFGAKACADAQLNDQVNLNVELDYMRGHSADDPGALLGALLCASDSEGAAKLIIAELRDSSARDTMLYLLQDFIIPTNEPPINKAQRLQLIAVRSRPDVTAAISLVGRISSYPLLPPGT
jgi:tetratricopeptide (TPR) repeat protein